MKIGIDARLFGPKQGGLGRYIEQLILGLEKLSPDAEFIVFLAKNNWDEYTPQTPKFKKVLADVPWYGLKEQLILPRILKREQVDVMHFPHWNVPLLYRGPIVVTIHDLILWHFPDRRRGTTLPPITYALKYFGFKYILRSTVKRARRILTPSEFSKQDLIKTLKVDPRKIIVTYQAPFELPEGPAPAEPDLKTLGINKPYALYVGVGYPHKNLKRLVEAWKLVEQDTKESYQLVLAGPPSYFYEELLASPEFKRCTQILYTGFVSDQQLTELYQGARLYVMPSLYEGYALPALEALRAGIPVAASKASCLPEILGNAAIFFDALNTREMSEVVVKGLTNQNLRASLIRDQGTILASYSREKLAQKTFESYENSV